MDREAHEPPHRKLVSVRHVSLIKPLPWSQTHEVVMIDGWPVVVPKGQFAVNQKVLYFAIDCVLPLEDKRYEPYRFSHFLVELHGQKGWTVQTVNRDMHISQGMVFAVGDFSWEIHLVREELEQDFDWFPDDLEKELMRLDLKGYFKIRKWSTFYPRDGGVNLGRSPSFLPTTKLERVQNITKLWETHGDTEFEITEILVGVPMIFYDICGDKTRRLQLPGVILGDGAEEGMRCRPGWGVTIGGYDHKETEASISWEAAREQGMVKLVGDAGHLGLAGVLCGEGILGNPHMIKGRRFSTYAVCDDEFETWKTTETWKTIIGHDEERYDYVSLEPVPKFSIRVRLSGFAEDLDELMRKAQGASWVSKATRAKYLSGLKRKGLAFKTLDGSFSFKVIANDWLLAETEKLRRAGQDKIVSRPGPGDSAVHLDSHGLKCFE